MLRILKGMDYGIPDQRDVNERKEEEGISQLEKRFWYFGRPGLARQRVAELPKLGELSAGSR